MRRLIDAAFALSIGPKVRGSKLEDIITEKEAYYRAAFSSGEIHPLQSAALRLGVHRAQQALNESHGRVDLLSRAARNVAPVEQDWRLISELEILAHVNRVVAQAKLPTALRERALRWHSMSVDEQKETCRILYDAYVSGNEERELDDSLPGWWRDYHDQPLRRIVPRMFLEITPCEANCFGKGQMLCAFFALANAKHYGATPLQTAWDHSGTILLRMLERIAIFAAESNIELPEKLRLTAAKRKEADAFIKEAPDRFHMAVIVQLSDGSWYQIDPHMHSLGELESPGLDSAATVIDLFSPVLPGITLLSSEDAIIERAILEASMSCGNIIDMARSFERTWRKHDYSPQAAISLLAQQPGLLEAFVEGRVGVLDSDAQAMADALAGNGVVFVCQGKDASSRRGFRFRSPNGEDVPPELFSRFQIALLISATLTKGELLQDGLNVEALGDGMRRGLGILFSLGYRKALRAMKSVKGQPTHVHPVTELYEPSFRIGIEMIAHFNARTIKSNDVIMELAALCGGQHHAILAATEPLRLGSREVSEVAYAAARMLASTPFVLPVVREGLSLLEQAEIFPLSGDKNHVSEESAAQELGATETEAETERQEAELREQCASEQVCGQSTEAAAAEAAGICSAGPDCSCT